MCTADQDETSGFYRHNGLWFFKTASGRDFGPFDTMIQTRMEPWRNHETEIVEPGLSAILNTLVSS